MSLCNERRKMVDLLDQLASDQVLTQAFRWLCATRAHYHHNNDVWHVRYWWAKEKPSFERAPIASANADGGAVP
jgi:hypothetical protein